jgi:hypothetical protein
VEFLKKRDVYPRVNMAPPSSANPLEKVESSIKTLESATTWRNPPLSQVT